MYDSPLSPVYHLLYDRYAVILYHLLCIKWRFRGHKRPARREAEPVINNVTFIYKSFERQRMAKRLYKNIRRYYPGVRVIIADDSRKPLKMRGNGLTIVQLPFNRGLSYGLNRALERVETPFTVRLDDDVLLTPFTGIHQLLSFLNQHPEIHLAAFQACSYPCNSAREHAQEYVSSGMKNAAKPLIIPHMTKIDDTHYVMGKTPNLFLIRTEEYKALGYDDNIRMIDHHEFFLRAAGNIVSAMDTDAFVFHYHNRFDKAYRKYRMDYQSDIKYIRSKHQMKPKATSTKESTPDKTGLSAK